VTGIGSNSPETVVYYEASCRTTRVLAALGGGRSMASHVDTLFVKIVLERSVLKAALTLGNMYRNHAISAVNPPQEFRYVCFLIPADSGS
jgi:hypothetical protein